MTKVNYSSLNVARLYSTLFMRWRTFETAWSDVERVGTGRGLHLPALLLVRSGQVDFPPRVSLETRRADNEALSKGVRAMEELSRTNLQGCHPAPERCPR